LKQQTAYKLVQTGQATGYRGYWLGGSSDTAPWFRGPLFPALEQRHLRTEMVDSPDAIGSGLDLGFKGFTSRWVYRHKSVTPFTGAIPTFWPVAGS
jgi:hypothetical protein